MSTSNVKSIRKKYARLIEAEIFTINTEIENGFPKIRDIDYAALKRLNLSKLKRVREHIQRINGLVADINKTIDGLDKPSCFDIAISENEDGTGRHIVITEPAERKMLLSQSSIEVFED